VKAEEEGEVLIPITVSPGKHVYCKRCSDSGWIWDDRGMHAERCPCNHRCFGCNRDVRSGEDHIHVDLDDWSEHAGLERLGIPFEVVFCSDCIEDGGPWAAEAHEVSPT